MGYCIQIFVPRPFHYVTRSPGRQLGNGLLKVVTKERVKPKKRQNRGGDNNKNNNENDNALGGLTPGTYGGIVRDLLSFVANFWPGMGALECFCTSEARYTGKDWRDL